MKDSNGCGSGWMPHWLTDLVFEIRSSCKATWLYCLPEHLGSTHSLHNIIEHKSETSRYLRIRDRGQAYWPKSGFLEKALRYPSEDPRWEALTRNNKYFGSREHKNFSFFSYAKPTHKMYPECIPELETLVKLN